MEKENILDKTLYHFKEKIEWIQTIILGLIAFLAPTFLAQLNKTIWGAQSIVTANSQWIIGSIVNAVLIICAINLKGWRKIIGVVTMPSISTIVSGYVFGTASIYMVYMIPAIWLGNFLLIYAYKGILLNQNKNYFLAGMIGILAKVFVIFGSFEVLKWFGIFPQKWIENLQTAMGTTQLITATIGMVIAFALYQIEKRKVTKEMDKR